MTHPMATVVRIDPCTLSRLCAASRVPRVDPETRAYLDDMRQEMGRRFDGVDQRLDAMDLRFDGVDGRLDAMDERFDGVDQRFDAMDHRFEAMGRRFDEVDRQFVDVDRRFVQVDGGLRRHFGVLIESVRHEIQIVAEMVAANTESIVALRLRLDAR